MATAEIFAGNCGFTPRIEATMDGKVCKPNIESECSAIHKMTEGLTQVEPYKEYSSTRAMSKIHEAGHGMMVIISVQG